MLEEVSYALIFSKPVILFLGALTLTGPLLTAATPVLNRKGIRGIPVSWHPRCAVATICLGIIHGTLGVLAYL